MRQEEAAEMVRREVQTQEEKEERLRMCKACAEACREFFPEVPDKEMGDFLLGTTCYPFGNATQVRSQLESNRSKMTTDDWHECFAIADHEDEEAMKNIQASRV